MSTTATKNAGRIVERAFRKIGVAAKDEALDAADLVEGLDSLNDMLKAWQMTGLRLYTRTTGSIALINATASYVVPDRPHMFTSVRLKNSSGSEVPMFEMSDVDYDELPSKTSAGYPTQFFYDRRREAGTLYVWPVLATVTTETLEWSGLREAEDITASSDVVDAPAEWYEAIIYGLAARLCDDYEVEINRSMKIASQASALLDTALAHERGDSVSFSPEWYG